MAKGLAVIFDRVKRDVWMALIPAVLNTWTSVLARASPLAFREGPGNEGVPAGEDPDPHDV